MLNLALVFQNHMVLQRDKEISLWGIADRKAEINILVQEKVYSGCADEKGNWKIVVGPLEASFDETITISCADEKIILSDVQIGDVWLAGGQSNMEFFMRYDADFEQEKNVCNNPNIRFFDYPEVSYVGQIDEADYRKNFAKWRKADSDNLEWFSAVGYYFAKELYFNQNVPVGIIGCNWGGTPACAWMDEESIIKGKGDVFLQDYARDTQELNLDAYNRAFAGNPGNWKLDPLSDPFSDLLMRGLRLEEAIERITGQAPDFSQMDMSALMPSIGPKYERRPCGLYESMLKPLVPYGIKGFIYYQGETDGDTHPECYETLFPELINCWRGLWNESLPFLFVQLAPFGKWMTCDGKPYAIIREAQQKTADTVENTGMAVITDVGMEWDIHPKKKQPVGYRLALQAENKVYGQNVLCEAPTLSNAHIEGDMLVLTFENTGEGLYVLSDEGTITGIKVLNGDEEIDLFKAKVETKADKLFISNINMPGTDGQVVIGPGSFYSVNLYNSAGIPARPISWRITK